MIRGPLGGPRPLSRCSIGVQVTASEGNEFTEDILTDDIQQLDQRFRSARAGGQSSAVMTIENATVIASGRAAKFRVGPKTLNREQLETSLDIVEKHFGQRATTVAITIAD